MLAGLDDKGVRGGGEGGDGEKASERD